MPRGPIALRADQAIRLGDAASITHDSTRSRKSAILVNRRNCVADCQCRQSFEPRVHESIGSNDNPASMYLAQLFESHIKGVVRTGMQN
jgi:hypothetical protein